MIEKLKQMMVEKTIAGIELNSYQATNDTLIIHFIDSPSIKIMSDPKMCFDGLTFYAKKITTKTIEIEEDEEIK